MARPSAPFPARRLRFAPARHSACHPTIAVGSGRESFRASRGSCNAQHTRSDFFRREISSASSASQRFQRRCATKQCIVCVTTIENCDVYCNRAPRRASPGWRRHLDVVFRTRWARRTRSFASDAEADAIDGTHRAAIGGKFEPDAAEVEHGCRYFVPTLTSTASA